MGSCDDSDDNNNDHAMIIIIRFKTRLVETWDAKKNKNNNKLKLRKERIYGGEYNKKTSLHVQEFLCPHLKLILFLIFYNFFLKFLTFGRSFCSGSEYVYMKHYMNHSRVRAQTVPFQNWKWFESFEYRSIFSCTIFYKHNVIINK